MKKIALSALVIMTLVLLTSCQLSRTAITADQFTALAEAAGYTVEDMSDQFDSETTENFLFAFKDGAEYQIEFSVMTTASETKIVYEAACNLFEGKKGNTSAYSTVAIGNYAFYTLSTGGKYYVISRTDNTYIRVVADSKYKEEISAFLKSIGY
jgi:hypothetical protein